MASQQQQRRRQEEDGATDARHAVEVEVAAEKVASLRGLRVKNHFCSMVTVSRKGDREDYRQLVQLGDAPHAIDRAQDWFRVELDQMLLFEDGRPAVFVVQGAQSSPMWLHVDAFIEEARADFGEDQDGEDGLPARGALERPRQGHGKGPPSRLQEAATQAAIQLSTLQALNAHKRRLFDS